MTLYLLESVPVSATKDGAAAVLEAAAAGAAGAGIEVIEQQVTAGFDRVFTILDTEDGDHTPQTISKALRPALAETASDVVGPDQVRLVGADLEELKAARGRAEYLVEWDIPAEIDMDTYLSRKKEKSPLYANVPEVSFLRTYVREDTSKCLCFYNAPDEAAVVHAREVVSTPIDRLHKLDDRS